MTKTNVVHFTAAKRERVALSIALAGASGSGKTKSALELATGLAGPGGKIAVIDSEGRRALHYADNYAFDHCDFRPPYSPENCTDAIAQAQAAGYDVVILDSASDEYEGEGGLQDIADDGDPMWKTAKARHKTSLIRHIRNYPGFVIFCLRAEEKVKLEKINGKNVMTPIGWQPICEKRFMYDMSMSLTLAPDGTRGKPRYDLPCKLPEYFAPYFPENEFITHKAGEALRAWATGGAMPTPTVKAGDKTIEIPAVEAGVLPDEFKGPRAFVEWSELYLAISTPDQARAWEAKYRERIATVKARSAQAAADLLALFHERAPADPGEMFPGDQHGQAA